MLEDVLLEIIALCTPIYQSNYDNKSFEKQNSMYKIS